MNKTISQEAMLQSMNQFIEKLETEVEGICYKLTKNISALSEQIAQVSLAENPRVLMSACWKSLNEVMQHVQLLRDRVTSVLEGEFSQRFATLGEESKQAKQEVMQNVNEYTTLFFDSLSKQRNILQDCSSYHASMFAPIAQPLNNAVGKCDFGTFSQNLSAMPASNA